MTLKLAYQLRLPLALVGACVAARASFADPVLIAGQDFDGLSAASTFTTDSVSSGSPLTNAGSSNSGGPGLDFVTYWFDTRGEGSGPVTPSADTSDFIGVNGFAGSGAPNVSPEGVAVSSGAEHNFEFNDTDGRLDLVFEPVNLAAFVDRSVQFAYWIADTGYEADDTLFVTVSDGTTSQTFLNFGESELESNASADDGSANWKTAFIDLEELFDVGFGPTLTITISVDTNAATENVFVDNVLFLSGAEDPGGEEEPADVAIFEIQGAGHISPYEGSLVRATGIVTATDSNGFYLQDPIGDGDIATSDAVLVFTGGAPGVSVGDEVEVVGVVDEFVPGGVATGNLSTTEIVSPQIAILSTGNPLPAPTLIGAGGRAPPTESIDDDAFASFDPDGDGIDFFESLEAMLVTAQGLVAVSGANSFGEIFAVVDGGAGASGLSVSGTLNISPGDFNPERVQIDPDSGVLPGFDAPLVDVGASLGDVTGIVSYNFGNFEIVPTAPFAPTPSALVPGASSLQADKNTLLVATYNVLNLDPNEDDGDTDFADGRFDVIAEHIVESLGSPDIVALQEIQDNSGSTNDGVVSASLTLQALVDAIASAGGPGYAFIDNTFIEDGASGGQPGANIRVAFLYDPSRVSLVAGSVRSIAVEDQPTNPENPFFDARLPLVAEFAFNGQTILVVNNHFSSKGGSAPILGIEQPFEALQEDPMVNGGVDFRRAQATAVKEFVDAELAEEASARIVVLGDFNEFEFVSPLREILGSSLTNLVFDLSENERYSYIFDGNSQSLDHIFASDALLEGAELQVVRLNAEFAATAARASDHDPLVAEFVVKKSQPDPRERFERAVNAILDAIAKKSPKLSKALGAILKFFGFGA